MPRTWQDTVITVAPDGTIGADFTGHVHAEGLDLDAGTSTTPPDTDRIRWLRTSDGAAVASIFGLETAAFDRLQTQVVRRIAGNAVQYEMFVLDADPPGNAHGASLQIALDGANNASVLATANNFVKTILDGLGNSDYVQLAGGATRLALTIGTVALTWAGTANSGNVNVNHGLGRAPLLVLAGPSPGAGIGNIPYANTGGYGNTQFVINAEMKNAFTGNVNMVWLAIG